MRQRRTSLRRRIALPASGGLRLQFQLIKPFAALTRFQELLSIPRLLIIRELLCVKHKELIQQLTAFAGLGTMLCNASLKVIGDAYVSFAVSCLQNI